jgi:purine-nucleoside phosphorylase
MERVAIQSAVRFLHRRFPSFPRVAVVLGSGLGDVLREGGASIPYRSIPHFPKPKICGHAGVLEVGAVAVLRGRSHYYEGHPLEAIVRPVRILAQLGVKTVLFTNAAGTVHPRFRPGDLMLLEDHINLLGVNPLRGDNLDFLGPRFPDLSEAYDRELRRKALRVAKKIGVSLRRGVYVAMPGPSYETPAEIRMLRAWGADAVGMSTVPEVITARHAGLRVAAISCITNLAAGLSKHPLSHEEVLETNQGAGRSLDRLLKGLLEGIV